METDSSIHLDVLEPSETVAPAVPIPPMILWLGVLALALFFVLLFLFARSLRAETTQLENEAVAAGSDGQPLSQIANATLTAVSQQTDQIAALLPTLEVENLNWDPAMNAISDFNPDGIQLTGIGQVGNQLLIQGRAQNNNFLTEYAQQLEASGNFAAVVIQSSEQVAEPFFTPTPTNPPPTPLPPATSTIVPTSTPSATAVPTMRPTHTPMPTWTPTPKLTDDYEWDNVTPKPIFLGIPAQTHNFYPNLDIDHVTFLAKAGRTYEVSTQALSQGVDTFLTVTFGEVSLTNDDEALGFLSSSVTLQAPADADVEVLVQVKNRGVDGPDKWYDLLVQEVVPTTVTPSATATNAPPTITPSATPDLRDIHEPNDVDPNPIAIGEPQLHNFYPNGDVDNVGLLVKNGRFYQILTSQLAVGVDTAVTVSLNGESWHNDDYDLPGSDNFASAVCFPAAADGTAVATINQVGQQFDSSKTYVVSAQEVPFLTVEPDALHFGTVLEGDSLTLTQTVQIEGTEPLDWTMTTETPWLSTNAITGTTPVTLTVAVNTDGLAAGLHEGELTLGWTNFCRQAIPVTIQVDPVQSDALPVNGRSLSMAKIAWLQAETIEFTIAVTLQPEQPEQP